MPPHIDINNYIVVNDGRYYSRDHVWIMEIDRNVFRIGITDYAAKMLEEIVFIQLPSVNMLIRRGDPIAVLESVKTIAEVISPISGEILKINERLITEPELINLNPYNDGWIAEIKGEDNPPLREMMTATSYSNYIKRLLSVEGILTDK